MYWYDAEIVGGIDCIGVLAGMMYLVMYVCMYEGVTAVWEYSINRCDDGCKVVNGIL